MYSMVAPVAISPVSVADNATAGGNIISLAAGATNGGNIISVALIGTYFSVSINLAKIFCTSKTFSYD